MANLGKERKIIMNKDQLRCLLYLYEHKEKSITLQKMSLELHISKATLSRFLNIFYQKGYLLEKGKSFLSSQGCQFAQNYIQDIEKLTDWLIHSTDLVYEKAHDEAFNLIFTLSEEGRKRLIGHTNKTRLFRLLHHVKYIHGDLLSVQLDDGQYPFAFSIYKDDHIELSVANEGFIHPGILDIQDGKGQLLLTSKELEHESLSGKMILKGHVTSLKYQVNDQYIDSERIHRQFIIPIQHLHFYYSQEERMLETGLKILLRPNVGKIHMPESSAILKIIFK